MSVDISVVVVSFNVVGLLRNCLRSIESSLARSPAITGRIVVVDNASVDGSVDMVVREYPNVAVIALGENRGFGAANNIGLQAVESEYVFFLNPDTELLGDALAAMARFLSERRNVGVVGGRLLNPDLTFQHSCFGFPTLAQTFLDYFPINHRLVNSRLNGRYPRQSYDRSFCVDHPLGACLFVRRAALDRVGGFDESYFMYSEEIDLCFRVKMAGWDVCYCPDAEIIHHVGASTRQAAGPMMLQLHQSRDRFYRTHYGEGYAWAARQIVRLGMRAATRNARRRWQAGSIDDAELLRQERIFREING